MTHQPLLNRHSHDHGSATTPHEWTVTTSAGPVRGATVTHGGQPRVDVWKGIRYAAAPVGDLRFRAPRPPEPWIEPADALDFGPVEPQSLNAAVPLGAGFRADEDCLFLNVWAPTAAHESTSGQRPVLVWIHGGAYFRGAASQPVFDGTALATTGDVIVVTLNYRLGVFGFGDFSAFSTPDDTFDTNVALLDMIAALEWVRDNVAAFGGDPDNVTLFGESAGGGCVTTLMTAPRAEGLFHRAIAESSPATSVYNLERSAATSRLLFEILGLDPANPAALRELSADELVTASETLYARVPETTPGTLAFAPLVDGVLVPEYPVRAFKRGLAHRIPLIIGTNRDESSLFRLMKSPLMPIHQEAITAMFNDIAAEHPDLELPDQAQIASAYSGLSPINSGLGITREFGFRMPTVWIAEAHSAYAPTWLYRFDYAPPMLELLRIGATHATELPYVWGNLAHGPKDITYKLGGLTTARAVSERMQSRWLSFATTGDPAAASALEWPAYGVRQRESLVIAHSDSVATDLDGELRAAWGDTVLGFN